MSNIPNFIPNNLRQPFEEKIQGWHMNLARIDRENVSIRRIFTIKTIALIIITTSALGAGSYLIYNGVNSHSIHSILQNKSLLSGGAIDLVGLVIGGYILYSILSKKRESAERTKAREELLQNAITMNHVLDQVRSDQWNLDQKRQLIQAMQESEFKEFVRLYKEINIENRDVDAVQLISERREVILKMDTQDLNKAIIHQIARSLGTLAKEKKDLEELVEFLKKDPLFIEAFIPSFLIWDLTKKRLFLGLCPESYRQNVAQQTYAKDHSEIKEIMNDIFTFTEVVTFISKYEVNDKSEIYKLLKPEFQSAFLADLWIQNREGFVALAKQVDLIVGLQGMARALVPKDAIAIFQDVSFYSFEQKDSLFKAMSQESRIALLNHLLENNQDHWVRLVNQGLPAEDLCKMIKEQNTIQIDKIFYAIPEAVRLQNLLAMQKKDPLVIQLILTRVTLNIEGAKQIVELLEEMKPDQLNKYVSSLSSDNYKMILFDVLNEQIVEIQSKGKEATKADFTPKRMAVFKAFKNSSAFDSHKNLVLTNSQGQSVKLHPRFFKIT